MNFSLTVEVHGRGLYDVTSRVAEAVRSSGTREGLATVFVQHTSASLVIQEKADPEVLVDLQAWLDRAVPENGPLARYTHVEEGPDDMPAHIKGAITATDVSIPILDGQLALGTWQGVFLWEHRRNRKERSLIVHVT